MYKLMYLFEARPELREKAFIHDVHSFLSLRLIGRSLSSFGSADPSGLVDMRRKMWSSAFTQLVGLKLSQLPELVDIGYVAGFLTPSASRATGLPEHVTLIAGCGDGQLAGLGAGVTEKARGFLDLGTAVSCGTITDRYEIDQSFRTLHAALPGRYCLETTLKGGMLTLYWLAESLLGQEDRRATLARLEQEAKSVPPCSEGLITLPYWAGVMNPYWDDAARGAFIGLHPTHRPAHMYRSILEGIALELRLQLEGVKLAVGKANDDLVVLGGGSRSDLWCQILADVLGHPIRRCQSANAPALGAAVLASVAHGVYPSFERATDAMTRLSTSFEPKDNQRYYEKLYREVYRGLYVDLRSRIGALAELRELISPGGETMAPPPPLSDADAS
jgi:xylulokinase